MLQFEITLLKGFLKRTHCQGFSKLQKVSVLLVCSGKDLDAEIREQNRPQVNIFLF